MNQNIIIKSNKSFDLFNLNNRQKYKLKLLLAVLPFVLFIFAFSYVPIFGWFIAFVDYMPGVPILKQTFTGLQFFKIAFSGGNDMLVALRNTLVLSGIGFLMSPVPVVFAIMLTELKSRKFSKIVQTFSTIPNFFSWIIIYAIAYAVFSTQDGVLNIILIKMNVIKEPTNVLINNQYAWLIQTCISLFKNTGYSAIVYIAAIASIDSELLDAADVDGAGRLKRIWHITIPCLMPTFFVLLILNIGNLLSAGGFDQYYVFANPFVVDKLEVIDTYTYKIGIQQNNYSLATAIGMMKSVVSVLLIFSANHISKLFRGQSII